MYKIGIIGTGRIANRFVAEAAHVDGVKVAAVYNPRFTSAEGFAQKHDIVAYKELAQLLNNADIVYVASPHETHVTYTRAALLANKHVLCEKPMAFSKAEACELYQLAQEKELLLVEAVKTAFCPGFKKILEIVNSGIIGEVSYIDAAFTKLEAIDGRELTDEAYGGSFTELGTYCMLPVVKFLSTSFDEIRFDSVINDRGIDLFTKVSIVNNAGIANVACGLGVKSDGALTVAGTKGYIKVPAPWWLTKKIEVRFENPDEVLEYKTEFAGDGLRYELMALVDAIEGKHTINEFSCEESIVLAGVFELFLQERKGNF